MTTPAYQANLVPVYAEIFLLIARFGDPADRHVPEGGQARSDLLPVAADPGGRASSPTCRLLAGTTVYTFHGMFVSDPMANLLKLFTYLAVGMTLIYSRQYASERGMLSGNLGGEFYVLALFAMLGQMIMISGNNMLSIYLGLELMSLSLYALVALRRDHAHLDRSGDEVLHPGFAGLGLHAVRYLDDLRRHRLAGHSWHLAAVAAAHRQPTILVFGLVFLVAGMAFKLGAVPFHMWVPDVYQGSPTAVTLLLGGAPKLATFAICIRILVEGLLPLASTGSRCCWCWPCCRWRSVT
jgi:NADH-quinone oxidoreductase subunit N